MADRTLLSLAQGSPGLDKVAAWVVAGPHSRRGWLDAAYSLDTVLYYRLRLGILALPETESARIFIQGTQPGSPRKLTRIGGNAQGCTWGL